jgi:hypothetical protein
MLVFLFNLLGYQFLISFLQQKADVKLESRIDNNEYDDAQLVEMRVSLNMPYQQRYTAFERHYGEINIDGKIYTYVKRKIEGDVLILKCIPNELKQQLKEKSGDITKSNTGDTPDNSKKNTSSSKVFAGDYDDKNFSYAFYSLNALSVDYNSAYYQLTGDGYLDTLQQPPDTSC